MEEKDNPSKCNLNPTHQEELVLMEIPAADLSNLFREGKEIKTKATMQGLEVTISMIAQVQSYMTATTTLVVLQELISIHKLNRNLTCR